MSSSTSRHERAADEFAQRAQEELGEAIHQLLLYGSTVRGETRGRDSDVDIFVVLNTSDVEERLREIAYDVSLEYGLVIAIQTQSRDRFEGRRNTLFIRNVLREGRSYA